MGKSNFYYIPGLGTDARVFDQLRLQGASINYLPFLNPKKGESIGSYAGRMSENIHHDEDVVLVGLSFGGILAQEIAALRPIEKIILVSTVKSPQEIPLWMRLGKYFPVHTIPVPVKWRTGTVRTWGRAFGIKHAVAINMFKDMMEQYSDLYYRWSTHQIISWKGKNVECPLLHIQGDDDRVFPLKNIQDCIVVKGGTHSMIYTHAEIVSAYINAFVNEGVTSENADFKNIT